MSQRQEAAIKKPTAEVRDRHGESDLRSILPEQIDWKPFAAFPPSARLAVLVGQPMQPGPYTIRVKVPRGVKLMPHRHPEDRVYTVISGVFYMGSETNSMKKNWKPIHPEL